MRFECEQHLRENVCIMRRLVLNGLPKPTGGTERARLSCYGFSGIARARATEQHETGHLARAIEASDRRALRLQAIGVDFSRVFSLNNYPVRSSWPLRRVTFGPQARVSVRFCTTLQSRQELCTTRVVPSRLHFPSLENRGQLHCAGTLGHNFGRKRQCPQLSQRIAQDGFTRLQSRFPCCLPARANSSLPSRTILRRGDRGRAQDFRGRPRQHEAGLDRYVRPVRRLPGEGRHREVTRTGDIANTKATNSRLQRSAECCDIN